MSEISDTELIKVVTTDREAYQEAALVAAENELSKRNLTFEQIATAKKINEAEKTIRDKKANTPLDSHWKIVAFFFPAIFQLIISGIFKGEGYDRKANELTWWTLYGIGFYILLIIFISVS
ncbi:MAG: hypothetical protein ABIR18_01965 [Chitinophagaceae bacterium]